MLIFHLGKHNNNLTPTPKGKESYTLHLKINNLDEEDIMTLVIFEVMQDKYLRR